MNSKKNLERIGWIKDTIGDEVDLMVYASQSYVDNPWTDIEAIRVAWRLEDYGVFWLEERLHPDNIERYRRLCGRTTVPIASGGNEYTRFGFQQLMAPRAVDIVQLNMILSKGVSECKKIAAMASTCQIACAPHYYDTGVGLMANIHFIASTANCFILEYDRTVNTLRDELMLTSLLAENGYVRLQESPRPGLIGIETFKERFRFLVTGNVVDTEQQARSSQLTFLEI